MTLRELQQTLRQCQSLTVCDEFLREHLHEIRPLFYGLTRSELQSCCFEYEDTFYAFVNSSTGYEIQQGIEPPSSVVALLIFFFSLFERAGLFTAIRVVAELLPNGSLRNRTEAIFEYKNITDARKDYIERFDRIVELIHDAWTENPEVYRTNSEDLLLEYALDALLLPKSSHVDLREAMMTCFQDPVKRQRYPLLNSTKLHNVFNLDFEALSREHTAVRSRIVESLHSEACELVPESLICRVAEDLQGEEIPSVQKYKLLPGFIDAQLTRMGASYQKQYQGARFNFGATPEDNRIYLGTYFPRTVIESWNIFSELLSVPVISSAISQKDTIRILDIGSGTGAAVVGVLLALSNWGRCNVPIEVTSMDINQDALVKQGEFLENLRESISLDFTMDLRHVDLPFDLDGFVQALSAIEDKEGRRYDLITNWKCLCEFYNMNFASAQGIICNTIQIVSQMLLPYGLYILSDLTTSDNGCEFFSMTLNREANKHDINPESSVRTILPLPCARSSSLCNEGKCYTQRRFVLGHQLVRNDITKIAYRVFAPNSFAQTIGATFTQHPAYRVNAARATEACFGGRKGEAEINCCPCGYTGFFAERD